ncbi:protein kinase [Spongiactinospora sp. 9N601]|uniref:serine/threonine protein kinase n=1 Tax=Spongiactinospora sp. 9N601 TaxID=3375149 RepID=UPI00378A3046
MTDRTLGDLPSTPRGGDGGGLAEGQGRLVGRRYRLGSPVGRGGMGVVWQAHDVLLDRPVAVKELILPFGLDHAGKQVAHRRMIREARSAARLSHPGIVTVHDVVEDDGRPWIVMELVRAWSLEQAVRETGPLPVGQAAEIGIRVLDALRHAHDAGILHRDVKPGNVLLTADRVVLTDFGIAAIEGDVSVTQTGLLMGSPAYIPPERLRGLAITQAADLWSFGATMYAAVEGRPPYEGPDAVAVLGAVLTEEPTRPERAGELLPLIEGLLRKDPAARLSASQVSDILEQVLRGHGSAGRAYRNAAGPPSYEAAPPAHLLPPLDPPSGPMPSRIIETPSGPVRVPYDPVTGFSGAPEPAGAEPDAFGGPSGGHAGLGGPSGPHRTGYDSLASPSQPLPPEFGGPSGSHRTGYDSLASPSQPLAADFGGPSGGHDLRGGGQARRPAPKGRHDGGERPPARNPGRVERRPGTRGRLLIAGAGLAAVVVVAVALVRSGAAPGEQAAPPVPTAQSPTNVVVGAKEVPKGFSLREKGGVAAAVPRDWRVSAKGGRVTFAAPDDTEQTVTVEKAAPAADGGMAALRKARESTEFTDYIQVRLQGVTYGAWKAAEWEYTHTLSNGVPMHTLVRYVSVGAERAYRITFSMPDMRWDDSAEIRQTFFGTFGPED